jgi:hypothetical protein
MLSEGNQIHNFTSSSNSGTVANYDSGSDFDLLTCYGYGSGSASQKVTVSTVPDSRTAPHYFSAMHGYVKDISTDYTINPTITFKPKNTPEKIFFF